MIEISEGNTNSFLMQGVIAVIFAGIVTFLFWPVGVILLILAFGIFAGTNGFELDPQNKRYRQFGKIWFVKFGTWVSLSDAVECKLVLSSENGAYASGLGNTLMPGSLPRTSVKVLTYDIVTKDSQGKSKTIYEFLKYGQAKKALNALAVELNLPVTNKVEEKLVENQRKRRG